MIYGCINLFLMFVIVVMVHIFLFADKSKHFSQFSVHRAEGV